MLVSSEAKTFVISDSGALRCMSMTWLLPAIAASPTCYVVRGDDVSHLWVRIFPKRQKRQERQMRQKRQERQIAAETRLISDAHIMMLYRLTVLRRVQGSESEKEEKGSECRHVMPHYTYHNNIRRTERDDLVSRHTLLRHVSRSSGTQIRSAMKVEVVGKQ